MVTNHIIGRYRSRIVSFYTFVMRPTSKYETEKTYIVLQVMLPKKYTHIFVRPTTSLTALRISRAMPSSLEKHTFESMGFNEQYDIYSHPDDALSSFELIEPQFMELLMNMQNKYSFEVVDTILYFYAVHSPQVIADDYDELFTILDEVCKRMER